MTEALAAAPAPPAAAGRSPFAVARRRFLANRPAVAGLAVVLLVTLACLLGPALLPFDPESADFDRIAAPPAAAGGHWLGTDALGRDLLARVLAGGRISLAVGAAGTLVSVVIGVLYGAVAGFAGGRTGAVMMRAVDILYAMPFMFFVIMLTVFLGRGLWVLFLAIGAVQWLTIAVVVRAQTLALKQREFVAAARAGGLGDLAIIREHIVPNCLGPVVVYAGLAVPDVILGESFLSFLGLGVQEPRTSWGVLIEQGAAAMTSAPWLLLVPGGFLVVTLLALNFVAGGLRDALDAADR
ncbi:MAG: ABC transporter permease subunit [Dongiaceae bacterium]